MDDPRLGVGGNKPPVTPPSEQELLDDLRARYPEVEPKLDELLKAAASVPEKIGDDETAGQVQDLYRQIKKFQSTWKAWRTEEKRPWDTLAKVAMNFFKTPEDKLEEAGASLKERHTAFTEKKAEEARAEAAKKAEAERAESERLRKEAEAAEQRRLDAEQAEREAREREERARAEEEAARERRRIAEEAAARAKAEEKRIEAERKERERIEREQVAESIRTARKLLKEAEGLHEIAMGDEDAEPDPRLEALACLDGEVNAALDPIRVSTMLSDEQRVAFDAIRQRNVVIRAALIQRLSAKDRKKRAAEEKKRQEEEARAAELRRRAREEDERRSTAAKAERERLEAEAQKARDEAKAARKDACDAADEADEAVAEQREHGRAAAQTGKQADKIERRADRMDSRLANSSDADMSRTRGDYSTGSLSGRWSWRVKDRDALVATLGVLGPYIHVDAVDAALTKFMRQHQGEWADQRKAGVVEGKLPGVIFDWVSDSRIV